MKQVRWKGGSAGPPGVPLTFMTLMGIKTTVFYKTTSSSIHLFHFFIPIFLLFSYPAFLSLLFLLIIRIFQSSMFSFLLSLSLSLSLSFCIHIPHYLHLLTSITCHSFPLFSLLPFLLSSFSSLPSLPSFLPPVTCSSIIPSTGDTCKYQWMKDKKRNHKKKGREIIQS